jgi:kynurenine formamidase
MENTRKLTLEDIRRCSEELRSWNRWGQDDEVGTLNLATPEKVVEAAKLITKGETFALAINFDANGPQWGGLGRFNPVHAMTATGIDATHGVQDDMKIRYAEDLLALPIHAATHWDSLSHIFYDTYQWNGHLAELVTAKGALKNGIEKVKDRMVGRGVLLDIARYKGVEALDDGYAITNEDLYRCAENQNLKVESGDFLLVRTGQLGERLRAGEWGGYAGGDAPGLAFETLRWLHEHEVAAVASDTWGVEVRPNETDEAYQPWHWVAIPNMGLSVGEMFYLEELAEGCAGDGSYEFFFIAPPLPIPGGSGSPVNPIAIK